MGLVFLVIMLVVLSGGLLFMNNPGWSAWWRWWLWERWH